MHKKNTLSRVVSHVDECYIFSFKNCAIGENMYIRTDWLNKSSWLFILPFFLNDYKWFALHQPSWQRSTWMPYTGDRAVEGRYTDFSIKLTLSYQNKCKVSLYLLVCFPLRDPFTYQVKNKNNLSKKLTRITNI